MAQIRRCKHCHQLFGPRPQNPNQQYCSAPACQQARKRDWHRQKLQTDPDYRANQHEAQRSWREKNPGYWREYRKRNPNSARRNRERQHERNQRLREQCPGLMPIAKMDASAQKSSISPGRYLLSRIDSGVIAKMDALIVEINVVSSG